MSTTSGVIPPPRPPAPIGWVEGSHEESTGAVASLPFELPSIVFRTENEGESKQNADQSSEDGYETFEPGSGEEDEEGSLGQESEEELRQLLARSPQLSSAFF